MREEWTANRYHKPADVVMPDWDLTGTSEDLKVYFAVGYRVAQADKIPGMEAGQRVQGQARRDAEEVGWAIRLRDSGYELQRNVLRTRFERDRYASQIA